MVAAGRPGTDEGAPTRTDDSAWARLAATVTRFRERAVATLRDRLRRVSAIGGLALQAGLAAALSWLLAHDILNVSQPVFAPISAVSTLAASVGQRLRRTVELIIGVSVGVLVGDLLLAVLGTGWWQLALIVVLAVLVALFLVGSAAVVPRLVPRRCSSPPSALPCGTWRSLASWTRSSVVAWRCWSPPCCCP